MTKPIGLAKHAYVGAPKPITSSPPFGRDDHEKRQAERHWSFKSRKVRKAELFATL